MITLGLVQAPATSDACQNFNTIKGFVSKAKENNCQALCFPEAFLTGYFPQNAAELALSSNCGLLKQLSLLAQKENIDLLVGFMEKRTQQYFLTHGLFAADGNRQFYRKTHLGTREKEYFTPGKSLEVFSLSCGLKTGIQLCVENHFPEITQTLSLRGAQVVFAPHAIPRVSGDRKEIWSKFIPARSYDNRIYMACCNQWDEIKFGGGCFVTDPNGEIVASCFKDAPALLCFEIEPEKIDYCRSHHYYPTERRTSLYNV